MFRRQAVTLSVGNQCRGRVVGRYLKQAEPQSRQSNRELSERLLEDVEQNREEAVKRYAQQLDRWSISDIDHHRRDIEWVQLTCDEP